MKLTILPAIALALSGPNVNKAIYYNITYNKTYIDTTNTTDSNGTYSAIYYSYGPNQYNSIGGPTVKTRIIAEKSTFKRNGNDVIGVSYLLYSEFKTNSFMYIGQWIASSNLQLPTSNLNYVSYWNQWLTWDAGYDLTDLSYYAFSNETTYAGRTNQVEHILVSISQTGWYVQEGGSPQTQSGLNALNYIDGSGNSAKYIEQQSINANTYAYCEAISVEYLASEMTQQDKNIYLASLDGYIISINYALNVMNQQDSHIDYEIVDIPGLMFTVLGMPFAWISTAFNLTIFPGTPYAVNIANIFMSIIGVMILIFILKKIIK